MISDLLDGSLKTESGGLECPNNKRDVLKAHKTKRHCIQQLIELHQDEINNSTTSKLIFISVGLIAQSGFISDEKQSVTLEFTSLMMQSILEFAFSI